MHYLVAGVARRSYNTILTERNVVKVRAMYEPRYWGVVFVLCDDTYTHCSRLGVMSGPTEGSLRQWSGSECDKYGHLNSCKMNRNEVRIIDISDCKAHVGRQKVNGLASCGLLGGTRKLACVMYTILFTKYVTKRYGSYRSTQSSQCILNPKGPNRYFVVSHLKLEFKIPTKRSFSLLGKFWTAVNVFQL